HHKPHTSTTTPTHTHLLLPPPPRPPPFPYTTLFRSVRIDRVCRACPRSQSRHAHLWQPTEPLSQTRRGRPRRENTSPLPRRDERDRKSTRLNSSHLVISYAVFCLKKKKERNACSDDL